MALTTGTRIGPYEVTSPLGEGGMGVVVRARDAKLQRDVALKLLPDHFADDPDRLSRFLREAQILASLNHPNIAQIYGLEESGNTRCIVMELVEGQTLAERIMRGRMPVDEAHQIAGRIAEALDAAHEKGIVHRDLKPANVKITPDGSVKVLDFGLAKTFSDTAIDLSNSPTVAGHSEEHAIVGTASYMSPEQARGKAVDKRTDIWAFGVVLYEMLTGTRPFRGDTASDILASVLKEEPEWDSVPSGVQQFLKACLQKDQRLRLRDIGDVRLLLERVPNAGRPRRSLMPFAIVVAILAAGVLGLLWRSRPIQQTDQPLIRLSADLGPQAVADDMLTIALSPDGSRIAFLSRGTDGRRSLATRRLDESKITALPGTEAASSPFFSPDGQWIGFFANRELKKILVQGGAPVLLAAGSTARGGAWDWDGNSIIAELSNRSPLVRIPAAGGSPEPLTHLDPGEISHRWPQVLPGGRTVLFTGRSPTLNTYENAAIDVVTLKTGERKTLLRGGYFGRYLPTRGVRGHLVFIHEGTLFAVPMDPERLALEGTPVPIVDDIGSDPNSGAGQFDFSSTGTLAYLSGSGRRSWAMSLLDSTGKTEPLFSNPGMYYSPRFSPDGRKLAYAIEAGNGSDIFVYDFSRQSTARLTFTQQGNIEPLWTPDGNYIAYRSIEPAAMWWMRADGGGEPQLLLKGVGAAPLSFTPDGKYLAISGPGRVADVDISIVQLDLSDPDHPKPGVPQPLLASAAAERYAAFSPDGKWLAYASDESSRTEVYVRRVSEPGGKWQISTGGGNMPVWSRQSYDLFFVGSGNKIMVAGYEISGNSLSSSKPRLWSPTQILDPGYFLFDLAPDGKRFAVLTNPEPVIESPPNLHVTFLLHFFDELRRRAR